MNKFVRQLRPIGRQNRALLRGDNGPGRLMACGFFLPRQPLVTVARGDDGSRHLWS